MPRKIFVLIGLTCIAILAGTSVADPPPSSATPASRPAPELARARMDAARKAYQLFASDYRAGWLRSSELVYRWSRRWLESEQDLSARKEDHVAALEAHLQRMRDVARLAQDRFKHQDTTIDEATS